MPGRPEPPWSIAGIRQDLTHKAGGLGRQGQRDHTCGHSPLVGSSRRGGLGHEAEWRPWSRTGLVAPDPLAWFTRSGPLIIIVVLAALTGGAAALAVVTPLYGLFAALSVAVLVGGNLAIITVTILIWCTDEDSGIIKEAHRPEEQAD